MPCVQGAKEAAMQPFRHLMTALEGTQEVVPEDGDRDWDVRRKREFLHWMRK